MTESAEAASRDRAFLPWMTWLLAVVNAAVFGAVTLPQSQDVVAATDPGFTERLDALTAITGPLSFVPAEISQFHLTAAQLGFRPADPQLVPVISSMFLHAEVPHLLVNLALLLVFGNVVEKRLGHLGYLVAYLIAGIAATLTFAMTQLGSPIPLIGASGPIAGVLGLHFVLYGTGGDRMFVGVDFRGVSDSGDRIDPGWAWGSRFFIVAFLVADVALPFLRSAENLVDYGVHLAGFAGGVFLALWLFRYESHFDQEEDAPLVGVDPAEVHLNEARERRGAGMIADAWVEYQAAADSARDPAVRQQAIAEQDALELTAGVLAELKDRGFDLERGESDA